MSELSNPTGSDRKYCPPESVAESSDEEYVNSLNESSSSEKIFREDQDHDTSSSDDDDQHEGKYINKEKNPITYGHKQNKGRKKCQINTTVTVKTCTKREDKKRVWDKRHFCLYCRKSNSKITRHLQKKHMDIKDVAYAFSFPLRSRERNALLEQLRNKGDFKHNTKVLKKGRGQMVTRKQPSDEASVRHYLPCHYCFGMFSKKDLWRHQPRCKCKTSCDADDTQKQRGSVQSRAARLLPIATSFSGCQDIINNMRQDDVSLHVRRDELICKYGESLYAKHSRLKSRHHYVSQRMRELGQFVLTAKEMDKSVMFLEDLCTPTKFQLVVSAAKRLTEFSQCKNEYGKAVKEVKIGFCLKGAVEILIGQCLMNDDDLAEKKTKTFLELLEKNWKNSVSVNAHQTIKENQWNKQDGIPLTKDVMALRDHLRMVEDKAKKELMQCQNLTAYKMLNETVLAQVIVFNKRREGDASRLTLEAYMKANTIPINEDMSKTLSPLEKELSKLLTRMEVRGKRGRKVPVFFTKRMKESVDLLINMREKAGVPAQNPYLFARPGAITYIRGGVYLRKHAEESKAEHPELLRSTKLRKQVGTLCQLLDLSEQELEQVARFMGHDIRVHCDFYRQTDKTFQIAKISELLFAIEQGTATLPGKNLNTINRPIPWGDDGSPDTDGMLKWYSKTSKRPACGDESSDTDAVPVIPSTTTTLSAFPIRGRHSESSKQMQSSRKRPMTKTSSMLFTMSRCKSIKKKPPLQTRRPWSESEKTAVHRHLAMFIVERRLPGKDECLKCVRAERVLHRRTWKNVKNFVYNTINTLNRRAASLLLNL
ncbi:hypothetical protein Q5P01_000403 [Channa striata]|uniref:Uncharacterized protein n=1 Tax=Channa striata TaxID=64152 RepID=A0AA88LF65_CHASR|nr:hypothetical protein Q5P01_000403 [Channa striata]